MTQKPGVATRLMYQVFIALNRKAVSSVINFKMVAVGVFQ